MTVLVLLIFKMRILLLKTSGGGFFHFKYEDELYVYQYVIRRMTTKSAHNKCKFELIYKGDDKDINQIKKIITYMVKNVIYFLMVINGRCKVERLIEDSPIFEININQNFPLEGCLLSLIRRKIMNYTFQTINIDELKRD